MDQRVNAAARAVGGDALQPAQGGLAEVDRKIRHDQEMKLLRDLARLFVELRDAGVVIAQVHLDDLLHVRAEFGEFLLDLGGLGPDAVIDQLLFVVGEVHDAREILAEADGVQNGELHPTGRGDGEQAQDHAVQ